MILYTKDISDKIRNSIKDEIIQYQEKFRAPHLVVILVGTDSASIKYVNAKKRACEEIGIVSSVIELASDISEKCLLDEIEKLNCDSGVDAILVQLPLPKHINTNKIITAIHQKKDVDGFHPHNVGNSLLGLECVTPCTPKGIMKLFDAVGYDLTGKNVVIVGRSNIVAKPLIGLFLEKNATVTITHSKTQDLAQHTKKADVLVVAVGKAKLITCEMVKEGAFVVDVGINVMENGKLCGDVDFDRVHEKCAFITPVPKGVGVMTITMLLFNTMLLYKNNLENK